jgi:hypothetical protein
VNSWSTAREELARAERLTGGERHDVLAKLATRLHGDARGAADEPKVHTLAAAVGELASVQR